MLHEKNVHNPEREINCMCPYCGAIDMVFIDLDDPNLDVRCDACDHVAKLYEFEEMHELTTAVNAWSEKVHAQAQSSNRLLKAVQRASGRRAPEGLYTFSRVSDDVQIVVFTEDAIAPDETVCIAEIVAERVLFLKGAAVGHPELVEEIEKLTTWEIVVVDGLIAQAAREWVYA